MRGSLRDAIMLVLAVLYQTVAMLPLRRGTAVFSSFPDAADNAYAMFLHLRQQAPELELIWIVGAGFVVGDKDLVGARLLRRDSLRALFAMARAEWVFHTHGIYRFARRRRGQSIVNLWHGMPLKAIGTYDPEVSRLPLGDVAIATSPLFRSIMAKAFAMSGDDVVVCGQPRNDLMVRAARDAAPDMALWMPTYRQSMRGEIRTDSPLAPEAMIALLRELDARLDPATTLVLKLHPMDALNALLDRSFGRITILRSGDPQEPVERLMARSRCLVTDYSSAAIDYLTLGRPIGYYCPDRADYSRGFVDGVEAPFFASGAILEDSEALAGFFNNPAPVSDQGSTLVSDRDDRAAERLWAALQARGRR